MKSDGSKEVGGSLASKEDGGSLASKEGKFSCSVGVKIKFPLCQKQLKYFMKWIF